MPVPTNTTPATATAITSLPFSQTVAQADLALTPDGTDYPSTCDSSQHKALWWKYTTRSNERVIAASVDGPGVGVFYNPKLSIWIGGSPLAQYILDDGNGNIQNFCGSGANFYFEIPVQPSTTYYFQVVDQNTSTPLGADLVFNVQPMPNLAVAAGSILIPDDTDGFPATIISVLDGSLLRLVPEYPAGETGDWLPTGELCIQDSEADTGVRILDHTFTAIGSHDFAPASVYGVKSDRDAHFYIITRTVAAGPVITYFVSKITTAGSVILTRTLPNTDVDKLAVSRDGATLYYGAVSSAIHRYDLDNDTPLSDLTAAVAGERLAGHIGDGFTASDGSVCFAYEVIATGATKLRRYQSDGTPFSSPYPLALSIGSPTVLDAYALDPDDASFWTWLQSVPSGDVAFRFNQYRLSDGSQLTTDLTPIATMENSGEVGQAGQPFGVSNSCPMLVLPLAPPPPTSLGTRPTTTPTLPPDGLVNSTPSCCQEHGTNSPGPILPPVDTTVWNPTCTGGGQIYDAVADLVDSEDWDLGHADPDVWVEFVLAKYPASEGTTTYRWAKQPFADSVSFKEGRLISLSGARRKASDIDGNCQPGSMTAIVEDADGTLRALLEQDTATEYFINREAGEYILSRAGRLAGLTPRSNFRGWVSDVQTLKHRQLRLEISDVVGSQFCGFNLEKLIGSVRVRDVSTAGPDTLWDTMLPIYAGEFSDEGVTDVNGASAEKGQIPVLDLGDVDITFGSPGNVAAFADPPVITASGVVGISGETTYYYGATLITPLGESTMSNIVQISGASARSLTNYNFLSGTFQDGDGHHVRIWRGPTTTMTEWLDEANYNGTGIFGYDDGSAPWPTPTRDELDVPKSMDPPATNTAQTNEDIWGLMAVCLGYSYDILDVYGSDLADGTEPKRTSLFEIAGVRGSEIITPDDAEWPYPDPWVELNGIRFTAFLARGNRLNHHRQGPVTFAVNLCGPHDADDLLVNQACPQLLWFLNEHAAKNNGTGYRSGDYGPLETYANGDPLFPTTLFDAAQQVTIDEMSTSLGAIGVIYVTEPTSLREVLRRWLLTYGARMGSNHFGQVFPFFVRPPADATVGPLLQDRIQIIEIDDPTFGHTEVVNQIDYSYHWDPDANAFRVINQSAEDAVSIAAHTPGGVVGSADRRGERKAGDGNLYFTNDAATVAYLIDTLLATRSRRTRYLQPRVDAMGLEREIGTPLRITHYDGLGSGDDKTPCLVLEHETDPDGFTVQLKVQDLRTLTPRSGSPA